MPQVFRSLGRAVLLSLGFLLFGVGTLSAQNAEPRKILVLHAYEQTTAPFDTFVTSFRAEILRAWPDKAAFYDFSLETARPGVGENEDAIVEVLQARFTAMKLDLVVTVGAAAAHFYTRHREELFPAVPIVAIAN